MPPTEILETVSAGDFDLMKRHFNEEPWGPWRDNLHAGLIVSAVVNAFRGEKTRAYTYQDFMFVDEQTAMERAQAEQKRKAQQLIELFTHMSKVKH